jgi:lysophospholipase L1-like esterase
MGSRIWWNAVFIAILSSPVTVLGQQAPGSGRPADPIKVVLVGDSTVALQAGWGPGFCRRLAASAKCLDLAANGRSTKSYIHEGLWAKALQAHGQFYFIQFGHNDQKSLPSLHTDPKTDFRANLHRYVQDVRRIGGTPILVTSLSRRNYEGGKLIVDPLHDYAVATREVAAKDHVPLIDLYSLSQALLVPMTQKQADRYDANTKDGLIARRPDRTHLNELGKRTFGDVVAHAVSRNVPALRPYIAFAPPIGN